MLNSNKKFLAYAVVRPVQTKSNFTTIIEYNAGAKERFSGKLLTEMLANTVLTPG